MELSAQFRFSATEPCIGFLGVDVGVWGFVLPPRCVLVQSQFEDILHPEP